MCGLFQYRMIAAIQNILFYAWSISVAKDCRYLKYIILCEVYFYNKRPALSKIYYSMCGLFLYRMTAAIQNILFSVWSISIAKDRRYPPYIILCMVYFYSWCCLEPRNFFLYQIAIQH